MRKRLKPIVLSCVLLIACTAVRPQNSSTYNLLGACNGDKSCLLASLQAARDNLKAGNQQEALALIYKLLPEITKSGDTLLQVSLSELQGNYFLARDSVRKGINYLLQALRLADLSGNDSLKGAVHFSLGYANYNTGNITAVIEHMEKAAFHFKNSNYPERVARAELLMGNVQMSFKHYDEALKFYQRALSYWESVKDRKQIAVLYNNISLVHMDKGDTAEAMSGFRNSYSLREAIGDTLGMGQVMNNIGTLYFNLGDYARAYDYFVKGYNLRVIANINASGLAESKINMGKALLRSGRLAEAEQHLRTALATARELNRPELQRRALQYLKELLAKTGRFAEAYKLQEEYALLTDSLFSLQKRDETLKLGVQYEYENQMREDSIRTAEKEKQQVLERQKERELQKEKDKRQMLFVAALAAVLLFMAVIAFILYRSNNQKKAANRTISEQKDELEMKQREIRDSITYARRIQQALLPAENEILQAFPDSFILFLPRDIISGDFYWARSLDGRLYLAAADCTGHGVPGALMSMLGISYLNEILREKGDKGPARMLDELHRKVVTTLNRDHANRQLLDGMDIALLCLDRQRNMLTFSLASRPLLIVSGGEPKARKGERSSIGGLRELENPFGQMTVSLRKGDCIYLFSDGYGDQFGGPNGKKYKTRRLQEKLLALHHLPMEEQKKELHKELEDWKTGLEQVDDVLVIGIRV
ncbi:MAG: SpoIIE family protein phosphatase [Bacteroidota bacterium]